jgi:deazaflavin-dependent oxidoreductase (nitroreductase family)
MVRVTNPITLPLAGKRWNPIFAVIRHVGRRSGSQYETTVAARRTAHGFVISLAFGAHVDWYRNAVAANGCAIRWRGLEYRVGEPELIDAASGLAAFNPVQRLLLRLAAIDGYVSLTDAAPR